MHICDNKIIFWTALLMNVCNRTILDKQLFKDVIFNRFCNIRYHTNINERL